MKQLLTLTLICCLFAVAQAQSPRMVLLEEGTNASCGPCAAANPALNALLDANEDFVTAIKYQWYFPGTDPMHDDNPDEANARVGYYSISGVPAIVIDGDFYQGHPSNLTQAMLDDAGAIESPYALTSTYQISEDQDSIYVQLIIEKTAESDEPIKAQIVVVEREIHFASAPGGNGETVFHDVMKKLLPTHLGTNVPNLAVGENFVIETAWELANIYDMDEIRTTCFLQGRNVKTIYQACNGTDGPFSPLYSTDATISEVSDIDAYNCSGSLNPQICLTSYGDIAITSATIEYSVNGGTPESYDWTGNIEMLGREWITLPEISFPIEENNTISFVITSVNGGDDDYTINNNFSADFDQAYTVPGEILLVMRTDAYPEETTWEITKQNGEVVASGGPYSTPSTIVQETIPVDEFECYTVTVFDSGNNGLEIPGFVAFATPDMSNYIIEATIFESQISSQFFSDDETNIEQNSIDASLSCYPNPATDQLQIMVNIDKTVPVTISIYNAMGQRVRNITETEMMPSESQLTVNVSDLNSGIYFVRLEADGVSFSERVIITK